MTLDFFDPGIWVNFGLAVAIGRFVSDVAFYKWRKKAEEKTDD